MSKNGNPEKTLLSKKQRILQEKFQRYVNEGHSPEQALAKIQREEYLALPIDKKIERLEGMLVGNIQNLGMDIGKLHHNQRDLADVFDVNFKAFEKALVKLGLSTEDQKTLVEEARLEINAQREAERKALEEQEAAEAAATAPAPEVTEEELKKIVDQEGQAPAPPAEATVFGG